MRSRAQGYQLPLRGLNPLVATLSTLDAAPVVVASQLRAGNAGSARGAGALLAEAIGTSKAVLAAQHTFGPETWSRADNNLDNLGPDGDYEDILYQPPSSYTAWVAKRAVGNGYYSVYLPAGYWVTAWDNYASC